MQQLIQVHRTPFSHVLYQPLQIFWCRESDDNLPRAAAARFECIGLFLLCATWLLLLGYMGREGRWTASLQQLFKCTGCVAQWCHTWLLQMDRWEENEQEKAERREERKAATAAARAEQRAAKQAAKADDRR